MRGRSISLSAGRRIVQDLVAISGAPKGCGYKRMRLAPVIAAIKAARPPTTLTIVLAKAIALAADEFPVLRRMYVRLPWPHLYEVPFSVVSVVIKRQVDGESALLFSRITNPAGMPIKRLSAIIRAQRKDPVEKVGSFKTALRIARLPLVLRRPLWLLGQNIGRVRASKFGTVGVTAIGATGVTPTYLVHPMTTVISSGPVSADGEADIVLSFDHRVYDGHDAAAILRRLEDILLGPILDELCGMAR